MLSLVGIASPKEFLTVVVNPDMAEFATNKHLRFAHHACVSLLSLRDWVGLQHAGKAWKYRGSTIGTINPSALSAGFGADLINIERSFGVVFDIANASKHMVLSRKNTTLYGSANVSIQIVSSEPEKLQPAKSAEDAGETRILVKIGGDFLDVLKNAEAAHKVWKELFEENGW